MKIIKKDLKNGTIKIKAETPDDAWKLEGILDEGDFISGMTLRSMDILKGDKKEKTNKKPVFIKIELEKKEFHEYTGKLRLMGKIREGPENTIGSYHAFKFSEGKTITIEKDWKKWQLKRLEKNMIEQPKILVCSMDEREAIIFDIGDKIKDIAEIKNDSPGKQFGEGTQEKYYGDIFSYLRDKWKKYDKIILAGPGFAKENLQKVIKERGTEFSQKTISVSSSHTGETGVQEIIKNGVLEKIGKESRIDEETKLVEKFLEGLAKDTGMVTYGKNEVENAVDIGAVEKLLVSEKKLKEFEKIMEKAEKNGADINIISENHESGQKLSRMGGIASILRFKIT